MLPLSSIVWIIVTIFIGNCAYALIPVFIPLVFASKNVSARWTGLIFGAYAMAVILVSPLVSKLIKNKGHANLIALGLGLMGTIFVAYSALPGVDRAKHVIVFSLVLRALQGTSSACI